MRRKGIVAYLWRLARTTSMVVGLAVLLALVAGVASLAVAKPPEEGGTSPTRTLLLGMNNAVSQLTSVTGQLGEPILRLVNNGEGPALDLQVGDGKAPMTVNEKAGTATHLSADKVDGMDSAALGSLVGVTTKTNHQRTDHCDNNLGTNSDNECAPVEVTVPDGKQYNVTVFSAFVTRGKGGQSDPFVVQWCPAVKGGTFTTPTCIYTDDNTEGREDFALSSPLTPAAGAGQIGPLPAGTYTFSTNLHPSTEIEEVGGPAMRAHTTVLVTDASAPGPPITGPAASSSAGSQPTTVDSQPTTEAAPADKATDESPNDKKEK